MHGSFGGMPPRKIGILHAPSPLGLKPPAEGRIPGVRYMADKLQALGLHDALRADFAGVVEPPPYVAHRNPVRRVRNADAIAAYSRDLAAAVGTLLDGPGFPLVLGGDCSIALGVAMALRRRGRFGLLYLDAHSDCQTPETSETGGVAGMPLMMITGRGPDLLTPVAEQRPQVAESDVVLLGCRDLFDITTRKDESHVVGTRIRVRDLDEIRRAGPVAVARDVRHRMSAAGVEQLWIHLDVDVLDPVIMPAVDSPDPGGLTEQELVALLGELLAAPAVRGMHVTIYDPERDPDDSAGALLVRVLTAALRG